MTETNNRDISEFNGAISYLNRLNTIFYLADDYAMNLNMNGWMHTLRTLFRELSTEMKKEEIKKIKNDFIKANNLVQELIQDTARTGKVEIQPETYNALDNIELELRKVMKESGLQMKMKIGAENALQ